MVSPSAQIIFANVTISSVAPLHKIPVQVCIFYRHNSSKLYDISIFVKLPANEEFNEDSLQINRFPFPKFYLSLLLVPCVQANEIQTLLWFQSRPLKCVNGLLANATNIWGVSLKVKVGTEKVFNRTNTDITTLF